MTNPRTIAFLGAGNMASAILRGAVHQNNTKPHTLGATDARSQAALALGRDLGIRTFSTNLEACGWAQAVVLAVKPQVVPDVLAEIVGALSPDKLVISIAAGISLESLSKGLRGHPRIIRAMPNAPSLVGAGATALAASADASREDLQVAEALFSGVGQVRFVPEKQLDAVTGLSGSGPAYALMFMEAMADAGVRAGLARDDAIALSAQTMLGAAKLVLETGQHPAVLRDTVTSPAGTTIAGVCALERHGLRHALHEAVAAAVARSAELGR